METEPMNSWPRLGSAEAMNEGSIKKLAAVGSAPALPVLHPFCPVRAVFHHVADQAVVAAGQTVFRVAGRSASDRWVFCLDRQSLKSLLFS